MLDDFYHFLDTSLLKIMKKPVNALPVPPIHSESPETKPLESVLEKNEAVQEKVEQSADELLLVNTVLKHKIPDQVIDGDLKQALTLSAELNEKLQQSADELTQVNEALEHEIEERHRLEQELSTVITALHDSQQPKP